MLELNAWPGLNIQIANQRALRHRPERVREQAGFDLPLAARIDFARQP